MSLTIENISRTVPGGPRLRDVSLAVEKGGVTGIIGPAGCGSPLLLRLIAGLDLPDSGRILFENEDITGEGRPDKLFPRLETGSGLKGLFSKGRGPDRVLRGPAALEETLGSAAGYLLLDDPFGGADRETRLRLADLLRRTATERGVAVIIATPDRRDVFDACDRAAVLVEGRLVQTGTPEEIYRNPVTVTAARLLGETNLIAARRLSKNTADVPEFFTLEGEHTLTTAKVPKEKLGAINRTVHLSIRPEHVSISFGASFPEDNLLKAKIVRIRFRGATTLLELDAAGLSLKAYVLRLVGLQVGDECVVGLPPDRIGVIGGG